MRPPTLRPRRPDQPGPQELGGRLILRGEREWLIEGTDGQLDDLAAALAPFAERLGGVLLLRFGNAVGRFVLPHLGEIEVRSGKWRQEHFDQMLAELTAIASELPFRAGAGGALPHQRVQSGVRPIVYQQFAYLRHGLGDGAPSKEALLPALSHVIREPHRLLVKRSRTVLPHEAREIHPSSLDSLLAGRHPLLAASRSFQHVPLVRALSGHAPARLEERRNEQSFDTAENRFVKALLRLVGSIIDEVEGAFSSGDACARRVRHEAHSMRQKLAPLWRARLWEEVGEMRHLPSGSTVLQNRRGYQAAFRCYGRLHLGARLPIDETQSRRLLEVRDIAELYELWCYFMMVAQVARTLGLPNRADRPTVEMPGLKVPHDCRVEWSDGTAVTYNARFSRTQGPSRYSYALEMRPDITLEVPSGPAAGLHLFDAKFRLQRQPEGATTFQPADLHKMHAYRDAIPGARSARVLYPGRREVFFEVGPWDGVGVVRAAPGEVVPRALVDRLLMAPEGRGGYASSSSATTGQ